MHMNDNVKEIILIRHGQTDFNKEMKFMGFTDTPLNKNGKKEAENLITKLSEDEIESVISSPLKRCSATAELAFPEHKIIIEEAFKEMNFGIFEGMTYEEIKEKYPEELTAWNEKKLCYQIPQGENINGMAKRVINKFDKILENYNGKTIIVTHSGSIRIILAHYLMNSLYDTWRFSVDHCKLIRLNFSGDYGYLTSLNE